MRVLIIEEISMVSGEYFEELEKQITEIRCYHNDQKAPRPPWGGLQVIVVGVC